MPSGMCLSSRLQITAATSARSSGATVSRSIIEAIVSTS